MQEFYLSSNISRTLLCSSRYADLVVVWMLMLVDPRKGLVAPFLFVGAIKQILMVLLICFIDELLPVRERCSVILYTNVDQVTFSHKQGVKGTAGNAT